MSSSSSSGKEPCDGEKPHVLAVDDNLTDRRILERMLKKSSYKVTVMENGLKALEYLQQDQGPKVDLILTDCQMPVMNGYELLKSVKESPVLKEIPVVMMSSDKNPTRVNRGLEYGAEEFLEKPLLPSDVRGLRRHMTTKSNQVCGGRQCRER